MHTLNNPWYKQFWPWALIVLPGTVVVASFFTAYLAAHKPDALVADDYYKAGLAINQELAAQQSAITRHITAQARLDTETARVIIDLHGNFNTPPATLILRLVHPTLATADLTLTMTRTTSGEYIANWPMQAANHTNIRWQVLLNDADRHWELSTHIILPQQSNWEFTSNAKGDNA